MLIGCWRAEEDLVLFAGSAALEGLNWLSLTTTTIATITKRTTTLSKRHAPFFLLDFALE